MILVSSPLALSDIYSTMSFDFIIWVLKVDVIIRELDRKNISLRVSRNSAKLPEPSVSAVEGD